MSTLAQLKTVVFAYLQTNFPSVTRHELLNNGTPVDFESLLETLFLQAANNARKHAEQFHDFQCAECKLEGVIPTSGLGLSWDAMTDEDDDTQSLRSIEMAYVVNEDDGSLTEVSVKRKKFMSKLKYDQRLRRTRYHQTEDCPTIFHHQRRFYCDPLNDLEITLLVDGYKWMSEYVSTGIVGVAATGAIHFTAVPVDGESIQIGNITYTWRDVISTSYDIAIPDFGDLPATATDAATSLRVALSNASLYIPEVHPSVEVTSYTSGATVYIGAKTAGAAGNAIVMVPSSGTITVSAATLEGGVDEAPSENSFSTITDYFLTHGFAYMQWATIVELNYLIQRFLPRQEGGLAPPTKERDTQLQLLINNDIFSSESGDHHDIRND